MAGKRDKVADKDRTSILVPKLDRCFLCGQPSVEIHEVFYGVANRSKSKEDGMCLPLCRDHHNGKNGVHNDSYIDLKVKQFAEKVWINAYSDSEHGIDAFIKRYGKNYL